MSGQIEDAFNEAVERRASGYEQRIAALDDLVQRAWRLIAGAMSGNPHKPIANSEWMDAARAWEIDYCMGARYAAATPDPPTRTGNVPQVPVVFASNDDDSREAWKAAAEAEAEAGDEARREVARLRALLAASPDERLRDAAARARPSLAVLLEASKSVSHLDPPGYGEADEIHAEAEAALVDLDAALAAWPRSRCSATR